MFSANAISSLPISEDTVAPRTFLGKVRIFLNNSTLAFPLSINRVTAFSLSINVVNSLSLNRNKISDIILSMATIISKSFRFNRVLEFSSVKSNVNKVVNVDLEINTVIDFSQRR